MQPLMSVREARKRLVSAMKPVRLETIPLSQARQRVLAKAFTALIEMPPFDNSSMDGFAVRSADLSKASLERPVTLKVITDIPAGVRPEVKLLPGQAARIVTGAMMPAGADAVVPVEDTSQRRFAPGSAPPAEVKIFRRVNAGDYVRPRGQDIQIGDTLLSPGKRLRPQDVGILASQGVAEIEVYQRPKVALLSTGDELVPAGVPLEPGKIYESNSHMLGSLVEQNGGRFLRLGTSKDSKGAIRSLLDEAVTSGADLILSSAGVSMGAFDYVRQVLEEEGTIDFWRVNMRPGKPLTFGTYRSVPFVGLPGNPVSSFVSFLVFVKPAIDRLSGLLATHRRMAKARLQEDIHSDGRESYLRACITWDDGEWKARLTGHQGSGNLTSLVAANALLIIPVGVKYLPAGEWVEAWLFGA